MDRLTAFCLWIAFFIIISIGLYVMIMSIYDAKSGNKKERKQRKSLENTHIKSDIILPVSEQKRFGNKGEKLAQGMIKNVLGSDDHMISNVSISASGRKTEIDCIIVNRYGVFIIEVKNYVGYLVGDETDKNWIKYKTTYPGQIYHKITDNPLNQAKRERMILKDYLRDKGFNVWIEEYVMFIQGNSPIINDRVLEDESDIDRKIHSNTRVPLNDKTVDSIVRLLSGSTK